MRGCLAAAVLLVSTAMASTTAAAQDFTGTRALGVSEAYRATATSNDAIYFNPAGLVVIPRVSPELHYALDLKEEQHQLDVSMVDSKMSQLALGVGYTFDGRQFTRRTSLQHTATLALAYPLFDKLLCVGAGLKYVNVSDALLGGYLNALSADVGVLARLPFGVSLAAVGYNLVPIASARAPLSSGFAASLDLGPLSALIFGGAPRLGPIIDASGGTTSSFGPQGPLAGLTVEADWHLAYSGLYGAESRVSAGVEYLAFESVPLRGGWLWDEHGDEHLLSVGAGFLMPYFGLDLALQQSLKVSDTRVFAASIKVFLTP